MSEPYRNSDAEGDGTLEEWTRDSDEHLGVWATLFDQDNWPWQVSVAAAEFVRDVPLEDELHTAIDSALRSVPGVSDVEQEDREVWVIEGRPSGKDLITAVAAVVDGLGDRILAEMHS